MKRILSVLLCLMMFISLATPAAYAMDLPVSSDMGLGTDDFYFGDGANVVYNEDGSVTITSSDKSTLMPSELMGGNENTSTSDEGTMTEVPEELGQASATVEDVTVDALGVPKDSSLVIQDAKPEMDAAIEQVASEQEGSSSELFRYDISVQDKEGLDWQPNGKVRLELDAGQKLHKNQKVYVVHVSDDGVAEKIDAKVNAAGKIEFETEGFSTFAGFTVDFEYEDAKFSIKGLTSILLSEVFKSLNMPLDVEDVKDVAFTDYSLISLEKQGNDWLLTSLKAFQTTESLKVTMTSGKVYDIVVTDKITSPYATISYNGSYYDGYYSGNQNGEVTWYLDGDYPGIAYYDHGDGFQGYGDGWSDDYRIYIDGPGTMQINLQHQKDSSGNYYGGDDCALVLDLYQIRITGGAKVVFRLGGSFSGKEKSITIRGTGNCPIFDIQDGSLFFCVGDNTLKADSQGAATTVTLPGGASKSYFGKDYADGHIPVYLDGNNKATSVDAPLIHVHRGTDAADRMNLVVEDVTFKNAPYRAVLVQTNNLTNLRFTNCTFASTVKCTNYGGGAMFIDDGSDGSTENVVDVKYFYLVGCKFNSNTSGSHGGAICSYGDVYKLFIDGCTFSNCTSVNRGGALEFSANPKTTTNNIYDYFLIKNTTFTGCAAGSHGGAIDMSQDKDTPVHLASNLTFNGCTFTDCNAGSRGGAIRLVVDQKKNLTINNSGFSGCIAGTWGGAVSVQGVIGNVSITGSKTDTTNGNYTFKGCSSGARGGAFCIDCTEIGNVTLTSAIFKNNVSQSIGGGIHVGINHDTPDTVPPTVGAVKVESCTFEGNEADGVGGGIALTEGTYASITVKDSSFTECFSSNYGGGIAIKVYKDSEAQNRLLRVTGAILIQGCTFDRCTSGSLSPEPYDHDGDSNTEKKETWDHDGDPSTAEIIRLNGGGGGGAIAIGAEVATSITIKDTTKDEAIEFQDCYTWNNGGAICFLQTIKTPLIKLENLDIDKCRARDAGSAIHLSNLIANEMQMTGCELTNNKYFTSGFTSSLALMDDQYFKDLGTVVYASYDASGTFRSIGNTTCQATISGCHFEGNWSYSNGGGVYWNANNIRNGAPVTKDGVTTTPKIKPSLHITGTSFKDNIAERDGGGVYVEATVTISDCDFESNEAWGRGGAIAQQVYNNEARQLGAGEATNLILDPATEIWNNHAVHGGGISITVSDTVSLQKTDGKYINYPVRFQLGGATVRDNWASGNGGGLYYAVTSYSDPEVQKKVDTFQKEVLIDNGNIYGNKTGCDNTGTLLDVTGDTTRHGGGIYMFSNQPNTGTDADGQQYGFSQMNITGGDIYSNIANDGNGGGIYLTGKGALCTITGGTIGGDTEAKANIAQMTNYERVQTKGCGGGIAIDGGASIIMRRPWKVNAQDQYLDKDGAVTTDPTKYVEDETKAGGAISNNKAHIQGAGVWLNNRIEADAANTITINGGTISNNKITATNGDSANGGGVYVGLDGSLTMNGGSIYDCEAKGWGGGVYCNTGASFTLNGGSIGSKDHPNKSAGGGGIAFQGAGTCTINGGTIAYNESSGSGGGIYMNNYGTVSITGGNVQYNKTTIDGGGIWSNKAKVTISNGSVNGNTATGNGGGFYILDASADANKATMSGGNIESNTAANGAGVYLTNSKMEMSGGDIKDNTASGNGGGAYLTNGSTITVEGNVSTNHANNGYGGGVYLTGTGTKLTVEGNINGNTAKDGGGVAAFGTDTVSISAGNIYDNTASSNGGGIYSDATLIDLQGTLRSNTATSGNGGGAYLTNGADLTLKNGTVGESGYPNKANNGYGGGIYATGSGTTVDIQGNVQHNTAKNGGGVAAANGSQITIGGTAGGTITSNQASNEGGGVYASDNSTLVTINGTVSNNTAALGGGVAARSTALSDASAKIIVNGQIINNTATAGGGGAHMTYSILELNKSGSVVGLISGNTAQTYDAGGVYASGSKLVINGDITNNTAKQNGGGIKADTGSIVTIAGNVTGNTATTECGGGVYQSGGTLTVSGIIGGSAANANKALGTDGVGGGLYVIDSCQATVNGSVTYNEAQHGGGAAAYNLSRLDINGHLDNNKATLNAGGAYVSGATLNINKVGSTDGTVDGNTAGASGGGIYADSNSIVKVDGHMYSNKANGTEEGNGGGGAYIEASSLTLTGTIGAENKANTATKYGGGVYVTSNGTALIRGTIQYNTASHGGGASGDTGATITVHGNLYENDAKYGGGAAMFGGSTLIVNGGQILQNKATSQGGGVYADGASIEVNTVDAAGEKVAITTAGALIGKIVDNEAGSSGGGAFIKNGATLTVSGYIGEEGHPNTASVKGGGVCATGDGTTATVYGSIEHNQAADGGGVAVLTNAKVTVENGNVAHNRATWGGGGIYCYDAMVDILSGNVQNNYSQSYGGGMHVGGASTAMVNGSVLNNVTDGNGGGIYCIDDPKTGAPDLTIKGNVEGNKAVTHGGGIYAVTKDGTVGADIIISGGSIQNNHANCTKGSRGDASTYTPQASKNQGVGGGVYLEGANLTLQKDGTKVGKIYSNSAVNGGGIYAKDATVGSNYVGFTISLAGDVQENQAVFVDAQNTYDGVVQGMGGGICALSPNGSSTITLTGGSILENTAQLFGGGAYVEGNGLEMEITGGNVADNTATRRNGGGLLVSTGASVTIANGEISGNKALGGLVINGKEEKGYGGGVHAYNGGEITITGGSITNNQADFGGGIAAEINAVVIFTNTVSMTDDGGNLSQNSATEYGGGIYAEASSVTVSGGTISGNTAKYGGGIAAVSVLTVGASGGTATAADPTCSVSVNGGAITSNYAEFGGGVYAKDGGTLVTVNGGSITMNQARSDYAKVDLETKANGSGGGIYVDGANVSVNKVGEAAGRIEANEASRGGGVYVTNGGDLTVKGGYIVKNVANGDLDEVGTALHMNTDLEGTGGGIFIADGASANDKSTFTLVSKENGVTIPVAIYGNLADYAADDVFANGNNTDLNVPLVTEMDLAGYAFKPGGWFEDYPIDDPYYTSGLNMSAETKQDVGDNNVYRYRGAAVLYRVEITPTGNSLKANNENTYVCMTLGIPGALPEDIVMDFGLPVDIDALNNDLVIRNEHTLTTQVLVGLQHPTTTDDAGNVVPMEYITALPTGYTFGQSIDGKYGKITVVETSVVKNGQTVKSFTIRYELDDMEFIGVESFTYAVCYDEMWYFADVRIVPATIIYFEDDFVSFEDGKWTPVEDKDSVGSQDGDRPGEDVNDALGSLDMDSVYGYDSHYANKDNVYDTYSNGSVHKTTVSGDSHAKATFTFWGTGFDVISLTSNTSGTVLVNVDRLDVAEDRQSFMVDTYYSYIYDTTTQSWVVAAAGKDNAIYQIPVIRVDDLAYGHYSVEVYVAYHEWFGHDRESYDFYLDAIRIYKPANDGVVTDSNGIVTDTTIRDIYLEDGECWPVFEELRDILLPGAEVESLHAQILEKREKLADPALTEEEKAALVAEIEALDKQLDDLLDKDLQSDKVVFIDGSGAVASVKEYGFSGPNNELYLAKDQAIYTTVSSDTNIASVHLGIKSLNGTGTIQIWSGTDLVDTLTIYGAMDMYYDVTGMGVLTIKNVSDDPSVLISITNVKTTYKADPYGTSGTLEGSLDADGNGLRTALAVLSETTETVTQPTLTLKYPSLSFEEEIRYNVYFTASDIQDVVEMGLITFGSEMTDGTIENALDVIPGYVTNGEMFMVSSNGIAARDMGDDLYFKVYAKLSDGSYVYTDLKSYSAVAYATTILGRETSSDASKALVVALLKYGAAAQSYFGDEGTLMDASLTAEQLALIGAYEDLTIADPITPDASKTAAFVKNGFIKGMPSVSFDGIFTINYYFYPEHEVQGDMKLYYWDVDTYESVEELTVENASGYITMAATDDGAYCGSYSDIAAKEIEQTLFVAAVYECDGVTYTTNVIGYSLAAYCKTIAAKETSDMKDLAKATAVYGYYAGAYFTEA